MLKHRKNKILHILMCVFSALFTCFSCYAVHAEEQTGFEAVAIVEVVAGFNTKYNLGLPYPNISECQNEITKIGLVFDNLHLQGVTAGSRPIHIVCEQRNIFSVSSPNS